MSGWFDRSRGRRPAWAGLLLLVLLLLGGCKVELYSELSEREANEMIAVLARAGIPAERTLAKNKLATIHVEQERFADAVDILKASGYPNTNFATIGDLFKKEGVISSPTEERARFIYGLSQELASTISIIDGVLSARVHVVLPDSDPLRRNLPPSSASVFVRHKRSANLELVVPQIKQLVANGIEGLVYDKVSVALFPVDGAAVTAGGDRAYLTQVAGLWIHETSAAQARWLIGALAVASVLGLIAAGVFAWLWRRSTPAGNAA